MSFKTENKAPSTESQIVPVLTRDGHGSKESVEGGEGKTLTADEYELAKHGYKQEFNRKLGVFEGFTAVLTSMNVWWSYVLSCYHARGDVASSVLVHLATSAFANWTAGGGLSCITGFVMAEISAAMPVAGGIYFWSARLGGPKYGPFLAWMTAWWNWLGWICVVPGVQQGATNFLLSALEIAYPDQTVISKGWFEWIITSCGLFIAFLPNAISQKILALYFRFAAIIFFLLFFLAWFWFPIAAKNRNGFQSSHAVFRHFYNGINYGDKKQASDVYCWVIGILFPAWVFYGFDASAHLAEETQNASSTVARGMWSSTVCAWVLSVPLLVLTLFCIQDFDAIVNASYSNNYAQYLVDLVGKKGAIAILVILFVDSTCATASCFMSAQRVTYAISRDNILPGSRLYRKLSKNKMPVNAGILVCLCAIALTCPVIGSYVAFSAITATATIATNFSYIIPIAARHTIGRKHFVPAPWNLGKWSPYMAMFSVGYTMYLFVVLLLPQVYPVTAETLNYAPIMIAAVTIISLGYWIFPVYGGMYWFKGPQRTISEEEVASARVVGKSEGMMEKAD